MSEAGVPDTRTRAEAAFQRWLDRFRAGEEAASEAELLAGEPADVREEVRRMIADFHRLRGRLGEGSPALEAGRVLGDFRLVRELGRGGMAVVWEAEQLSLARKVALKILLPHYTLSANALARFEREARAGGRLAHPGIVQTYAVGKADGMHWIAQELVPGGYTLADSLADLRGERELPEGYYRRVAELFARVADALEYAHAQGVIHRDVKPSNILIGEGDQPRVADFGLARIQDELSLSRTGELEGTPYYMSPEQAAAKSMGIDHRTDVFSLGSTLYEALTLTRAFDGDTSQLVFRKILTADPPDPRSIRSRVPRDLAVICLKTLEKDPGRRYAGAGEFAADLRRFVGDQLIRARPPGPIARSAKWCRRHQALAASGGVFALAFASVTGLLFENRAARRRIERAQEETQAALEAKGEALAARTRALERADSRRLLAESAAALIYDPAMALVLAIEAARREPGLAANNALLDAMNANYELRTLQGHEGVVYTARFSPDGAQVVTASRDGTARLWDVPTGECTLTIRPGKVALLSANFDPSGRRLVTASEDETARVWSLPKGEEMLVLGGHAKEVTDARFDWEGRRIVTTSLDGGARVWAADTGELRLSLEPQEANDRPGMLSGRFDGSGRRIVTAGMDGVARIWDAATGEQRLELKGQGGPVTSASFSPDGLRVLTASVDYSASIWNAETGALIGTPLRHSGSVYSAEFALDGKRVVTASGFNDFYGVGRPMAQIWDAHTGELLGSLRGHNATVLSAGFSPSGRRVVTGSEDGTVRLWDSDYRLQSGALVLPVPLRVRTAEFSADGKRLFVVGWDEDGVGRVKLLQLEDFAEVRSMGRPEQPILCAALSHDGRRVVLGSPTGTASVRDLGTLRELAVLRGHQSEVLHAVFAPDGSLIATAGSYDKTVRIWSAEDGALLRTLHGHEGQVVCVSFSPDGKKLLSASGQDKTTRVWSVDSGEALHVLPWKDWEGLFTWPVAIVHARFSPDGQRIVVAEGAKVARVWELASEQILATLEGHQSWVLSACFSPDGSRVATASGDGTARLWDWRTGTLIQVMRGHGGALSDVRFSPDGRWILTTSFWDTSVRRWPVDPLDLALASQPRVLTDEELRRYGVGVDEKRPVDAESSSSLCEAEEPLDAR